MATTTQPASARPLPQGKISYEEFLQWLDEDTWAEWVNGEVQIMGPVGIEHGLVAIYLKTLLASYVSAKSLGVVLDEPFQMKGGHDLPGRSPDVFFVSAARAHLILEHFLNGPADLVVEVVSPESRARDRGEKYYEYEQAGVKEYWLIDPDRKQVEFYVLTPQGVYQLAFAGSEGEYHATAVEGFWIRVEWLWQRPPMTEVLRAWGWIQGM